MKFIKIPRYSEFDGDAIWKEIKNDKNLKLYFRNYKENEEYPTRQFMFNVYLFDFYI